MKVLIALNAYEQDGPGQLMFRLCQRLAATEGLRLATVAMSRTGPLVDAFREIGVGTEVVASRGRGGWSRLREWADRLAKRPDRPDVIHTHLLWPDVAIRLMRKRLGNVPILSTCHGLHALDEKGMIAGLGYRVLERLTRARCDGWVAISRAVMSDLQRAGYPPDRLHLIPNGVDCVQTHPISPVRKTEIRDLLDVEPDAPLIVAAGTLRELKGHDLLLQAMPIILARHPNARLFIFGEGNLRDRYASELARMNLKTQVKFIGHLSTLLWQVLGTADVVVQPSRVEAFGLVAAEAQACETPVVATRVGGLPEIVADGETGFIVEPERPDEIADRICRLLADSAMRQSMGARARAHVYEHFEIGSMADAYLDLWKRTTGRDPQAEIEAEEEIDRRQSVPSGQFKLPD